MRGLVWKILLILAVTGICLWSVYPVSEKVRLGRDLRGGVSLVYHVNVDRRDPNPVATLAQVISVLKERVNPTGVLDISFQPMGLDRIEVVMPLPNEEVRALRLAYEQALEDLMRLAYIPPGDLQAALDAGLAVARYGGTEGGEHRLRIEELQAAHNSLAAATAALDAARQRGASRAELSPLEQAVADADIDVEDLRDAVLRLSLPRSRIERAMRLSTNREQVRDASGAVVKDPQTGAIQLALSPRDVELDAIEQSFPHLASSLDSLVAAYDDFAARRTGFDDPEDLMRLLRGAGLLEFHIAVSASDPEGVNPDDLRRQLTERGPANTDSMVARWFPINDLKQWYQKPEELIALQADPVAYFSGRQNLVAAERDGAYYLLLYVTEAGSMTHAGGRKWAVTGTGKTFDNFGRDAVSFALDGPGGMEMGRLTGRHVGDPMAIVLDGQVYSAPSINSAISGNGIIMGNFSEAELSYLIRVLAAGSLEARLTPDPIAINTLGPSIGQENLNRGLQAFGWALLAVGGFMIVYYFFAGLVADVALALNALMIFGIMAFIDGTYTLPGLAGIVLTVGMAVDANVLIFERIREELQRGEVDLRGAIRLGYAKALSAIVDSNLTTLLSCMILLIFATTEVKGFALTLLIGLSASMFTALFVTKVIFAVCTDVFGMRRLPMLATTIPAVRRFLEPRINWIGLRKVFWPVSAIACIAAVVMVGARGVALFDTEFRGGVAVMVRTAVVDEDRDGKPDRLDESGEPVRRLLPHTGQGGAEGRVKALAALLDAAPGDAGREQERERLLKALVSAGVLSDARSALSDPADPKLDEVRRVLAELSRASVLTVGKTEIRDGVLYGSSFQIKVSNPEGIEEGPTATDVIVAAITAGFGDELDVTPPLGFAGAGESGHAGHTWQITKDILGDNIERPRHRDRVAEFRGGVLVVIDDIDPPATVADVSRRVSRMRSQPDFAAAVGREVRVFGLEPADPADLTRGYTSIAVAVHDPLVSSHNVDFDVWDREVAALEWRLVSGALQRATSLEQVSSFSSAVAGTLSAQAVVSVVLSLLGMLIYIWVRFGSLRYSAAAVLALVHDTVIALGAIALSQYIGGTAFGSMLLIEEFRIDLSVVAALLTIIGYALNDTIVILDRIRENRGKLPLPTATIVNNSINQTFSRTMLTSTTIVAVLILYILGGSGIRAFSFTLLVGLVAGTYGTVAIAAPMLVRAAAGETARGGAAPDLRGQAARGRPGIAPETSAVR